MLFKCVFAFVQPAVACTCLSLTIRLPFLSHFLCLFPFLKAKATPACFHVTETTAQFLSNNKPAFGDGWGWGVLRGWGPPFAVYCTSELFPAQVNLPCDTYFEVSMADRLIYASTRAS